MWWFTPNDVFFDTGVVKARARRVSVWLNDDKHYETHEEAVRALDDFDVILIRQDPPFDMGYVSNTYLLELTKALVLNPPLGVRNISEKMSILHFPELTPKTWVGQRSRCAGRFRGPLRASGAEGALPDGRRWRDQTARGGCRFPRPRRQIHRSRRAANRSWRRNFCPAVSGGDKRLFVLDGEPFGAVKRMPQAGEFRANLHAGGKAHAAEIDDHDRRIAAAVAPLLEARRHTLRRALT